MRVGIRPPTLPEGEEDEDSLVVDGRGGRLRARGDAGDRGRFVGAAARSQRRRKAQESGLPTEPKCEFIASPGSTRVHAAVPRRLLHEGRPDAARPAGGSTSANWRCRPTSPSQHIEAAPYNAGDGFSPGSVIALKVPGIETTADVAAIARGADQPHRPLQEGQRAGRRDRRRAPGSAGRSGSRSTRPSNPAKANLEIHPAVNFTSGRPLHRRPAQPQERAKQNTCRRPKASATTATTCPRPKKRSTHGAPHFEEIFSKLEAAGIQRSSLYLAWDFTVASDENNTGRELSMRNARVRGARRHQPRRRRRRRAPRRRSPSRKSKTNRTRAKSRGASRAPSRCRASCSRAARPAARWCWTPKGTPIQNGVWTANFDCIIPAVGDDRRGRIGAALALRARAVRQRRRGRLGPAAEPLAGPRHRPVRDRRDRHVRIGRARRRSQALQNLSAFPKITDRLQQGLLDELYLGRAMISPSGFTTERRLPPGRHAGDAARC